jgi:hypothetical protein
VYQVLILSVCAPLASGRGQRTKATCSTRAIAFILVSSLFLRVARACQ